MSEGTTTTDQPLSSPHGQAGAAIPLTTRLALDIPQPKDWQAFQRNCVLLYRAELNDPHVQEYGRGGQKQRGIDVLGRRDGRNDHFVGVQCRLITKPLKKSKILSDAREALTIEAGLKELIFATTAPDDTGASDAAVNVTRTLRAEGHDITVVVYGWGQLQTLIAVHEVAYNAFHPSAVATSAPQSTTGVAPSELANLIAAQVMERMGGGTLTAPPQEGTAPSDEDPALHARIDTFRDLFKDQEQPVLAEKGLLGLLEKENLASKPWARYRIETNLGSIAMDLGREAEGATRFEAAHATRPDDPNAIANLALARTIQGRFEEAIALAKAALESEPRSDQAVAYLLQAAARSDWEGDPETLIPPDLLHTPHADIGLAEFLRRRDVSDWAQRSLDIARRHPDLPEFKRIRAMAVLSLAIDTDAILPGAHGAVTSEELTSAAEDMKAVVEHCLDVGFADQHDLMAYLNNAAVLLRLCERHAESEALLIRGMPYAADEPQLRRLLALSQLAQDRPNEAVATLAGDTDPENQLLRAELLTSTGDPWGGLAAALAVPELGLPERLQRLRWRMVGEAALRVNNQQQVTAAVAGLRKLDPADVGASLLEIRGDRQTIADEETAAERLRALASSVPPDLEMTSRYFLAAELREQDLPEEASRLLDGHVDLSRPSPATTLYLQSLAAARRDEGFRAALAAAGGEVRADLDTRWTVATHAWNLGDLTASLAEIEAILAVDPDQPRARLLKIEILIRQDRSAELFAELEKPLETLAWKRPADQFRLAALLGHFGFADRAARLAYRLFLQHRDLSRAWMTLSMLVLDEGRGEVGRPRRWDVPKIGPDAAVDLAYDDRSEAFFVIEPDTALRKLDPVSYELDHALVRAVFGLAEGDRFTGPDGREGVVAQIRHKYVARLHYVLEHHEERFPDIFGFKRVSVDPDAPGGLDELISQIRARHEWIQAEEGQYLNGPIPIALLAHRVGNDTIEVAAGLAAHGFKLKVATGNQDEREAAEAVVRANARRGCVLDLLAYWTAWRLGALDAIQATCGPIHLPQSVIDSLRARRDQFADPTGEGLRTAGYEDGRLVLHHAPPDAMARARDDIDQAIAWATERATTGPVLVGEDLPEVLREHLRLGRGDIMDALVLARHTGLLLLTDDLPTRQFDLALGGNGGAWLHAALGVARGWQYISFDEYVRWSAHLIDFGQNYLGVSGPTLARAAKLDSAEGKVPGYLFSTLSSVIGGRSAEPISHTTAVLGCLQELWNDRHAIDYREPLTGHLLRQLVHDRQGDYRAILRAVMKGSQAIGVLPTYLWGWLQGHFVRHEVIP